MCEYEPKCPNGSAFAVNGRYREVQTMPCAEHLPLAVLELEGFNDTRYKRRASDHGVMVYPIKPES